MILQDYLEGGTLRTDLIHRQYLLKNDRIVLIIAQLVEILSQLRDQNIIHRDIKPENILLDIYGNLTLGDFGVSRRFSEVDTKVNIYPSQDKQEEDLAENNLFLSKSACGTLGYAAPEVLRGYPYSFEADIYSVGVIFYEILFGQVPFPQTNREELQKALENASWSIPGNFIVHPAVLDLCKRMLSINPVERISLAEIKTHSFLTYVRWETLKARLYRLPIYHTPSTIYIGKRKKPRKSGAKHKGVLHNYPESFIDPNVDMAHEPVSVLDISLDKAYNIYLHSASLHPEKTRKGHPSLSVLYERTSNALHSVRSTTVHETLIWGRIPFYRPSMFRDWEKDVGSKVNELPFVITTSMPSLESKQNLLGITVENHLAKISTPTGPNTAPGAPKSGVSEQYVNQHKVRNSCLESDQKSGPQSVMHPQDGQTSPKPSLSIDTELATHTGGLPISRSCQSESGAWSPSSLSEENFKRVLGMSAVINPDIILPKIEISSADCVTECTSCENIEMTRSQKTNRVKPKLVLPGSSGLPLVMSTTWTAESPSQSLSMALDELFGANSPRDITRNNPEETNQNLEKTASTISKASRNSVLSTSTSLPSLIFSTSSSRPSSIINSLSPTTPVYQNFSHIPDMKGLGCDPCLRGASQHHIQKHINNYEIMGYRSMSM